MSEIVNLGKVSMTTGGEYNPSQSYDKLTCVHYDYCSWVSKKPVPEGVVPSVANSAYWQKISDRGERGPQGQSYVDKEMVPIVDDLTTGGSENVLSAEQGKVLDEKVTELESEINGFQNIGFYLDGSEYFWKKDATSGDSIIINVKEGDVLNMSSMWKGSTLEVRYTLLTNKDNISTSNTAQFVGDFINYTNGDNVIIPNGVVAVCVRTLYVGEYIQFTKFTLNGVSLLGLKSRIANIESELPNISTAITEEVVRAKNVENSLYRIVNGVKIDSYNLYLEKDIFWKEGERSIVFDVKSGDVLNMASNWEGSTLDVRYTLLSSRGTIAKSQPANVIGAIVNYTNGEDIVIPEGCTAVSVRTMYINVEIEFTTFKLNGEDVDNSISGDIARVNKEIDALFWMVRDFKGKKFSFLGDSITTFRGVSGSNQHFYPNDSQSGDYPVTSKEQTWWGQVLEKTGAELCRLYAYGGRGMQDTLAQHCNELHSNGLNGDDPDVILIFGGHNDFEYAPITYLNRQPSLGSINDSIPSLDSEPTTLSFDSFASAYKYTIAKMQKEYPNTLIVAMTLKYIEGGWSQKNSAGESYSDYTDMIKEVCDLYKIPVIDVSTNMQETDYNYQKECFDNIHPNSLGCEKIASVVVNTLKTCVAF